MIEAEKIASMLLLIHIGKAAGADIEKLINDPPSIFPVITSRWSSGEMDDATLGECLRQIVDINPKYKFDNEEARS